MNVSSTWLHRPIKFFLQLSLRYFKLFNHYSSVVVVVVDPPKFLRSSLLSLSRKDRFGEGELIKYTRFEHSVSIWIYSCHVLPSNSYFRELSPIIGSFEVDKVQTHVVRFLRPTVPWKSRRTKNMVEQLLQNGVTQRDLRSQPPYQSPLCGEALAVRCLLPKQVHGRNRGTLIEHETAQRYNCITVVCAWVILWLWDYKVPPCRGTSEF